ncbi:MAG TPA: hypothetical protein VJQ49_05915 [Casimicrobiaceae bacterium]|nr:hypothetical protein [Casimicrobiaceae bacterium]
MARLRTSLLIALALAVAAGCGKSGEQRARERIAQQAAMEKARADSIAEEREKDRLMREGAALQAREHLERDAAQHEQEVAAAAAAGRSAEQRDADRAAMLARYTEDLRRTVGDSASLQLRNAEVSPKGNAMCAEYNARSKTGAYAGYKRVVVIDGRVATEEPPVRASLPQFLAFQIAARDSGCFPDVEKVKILQ